jgi:hypothetical protein
MRAFKFLSVKYGLQDIEEHRVKISEYRDMNDPFELLGSTWGDAEVDRILTSDNLASYGAVCLSKNWSNPLLWSHYADKHNGICLGFDIPDLPDVVHEPIYVDRPEKQDPRVLYDALQSKQAFPAAEKAIMRKLLLKFRGWDYEDEVRLLTPLRQKAGDISYFEFDENLALREIIVGVRSAIRKSEIEEKLQTYSTPIRIRKARLSLDAFQVVDDPDGFPQLTY